MSDTEESEVYVPYSLREQIRARQGQHVVYEYDDFPQQLLVQVVQILDRTIGTYSRGGGVATYSPSEYSPAQVWKIINEDVAHEIGVFELGRSHSYRDRFAEYLLSPGLSSNDQIDAIEIAFRMVDVLPEFSAYARNKYDMFLTAKEAIRELNRRLRQHDMGYQFVDGRMVRADSEFVYVEVVEPAIALLQRNGFEHPEEEFMEAHRHFRRGEMSDALVDANKALESVLKIALERSGVTLVGNENASVLIPKVTEKILPTHLRTHLQALAKIMESISSLRSKPGVGHGAGSKEAETLDSIAGYALNITASTIIFVVERLVEQEKRKSK